jgi:rRNA-processing protein FCF1
MSARVALDASALMLPVQADLRLFEELDRLLGEHEAVVPRAVLAELEALARGNGEAATAASVGRDLADRCETVDTAADYADDALVELVESGDCDYVVTNDAPLRDRLAGTAIGLRGRTQLAIN